MNVAHKEIPLMKSNNETRLALLEQHNKFLQETLTRIQQTLDNNFYDMKEELKTIHHQFKDETKAIRNILGEDFTLLRTEIKEHQKDIKLTLEQFNLRLWTNFYWLLGAMFSLTAAVAGILAKGFHWF